jgi:nitrate/nitrite transporter NarK
MLQAVAFPCAVRTIGRLFADGERARASGWLGAGMLAGAALAPALTAWLLEQVGPWATAEGIDRWRICLVLYAVPGIVWAAAYWMATRTTTIAAAPAATASAVPMQRPTWLRACGDRSLLLLCGQQFLRAAAMIFFVTWFPTFLRETRGVSLMEAGLLTTCAGGAALLGTILGGYGSDFVLARTGSKRLARQGIAAVGLSACAVLVGASFLVTHVTGALTLISAGAFAAAFGGVAGYTVAMDYGGERVGTVFGAMNTAGNVGAMLFPAAVGWLVTATGTWNSALVLFAVLMVVDACLWLILDPRGRFLEPAGPSIKPT